MIGTGASKGVTTIQRPHREQPRVAFLGSHVWLSCCMPSSGSGVLAERFELTERSGSTMSAVERFAPDAIVVLDPPSCPEGVLTALAEMPVLRLGLLVSPRTEDAGWTNAFDRVVSFEPSLTGTAIGDQTIWRAIPPPVGDAFFASGERRAWRSPRALSVGRSTAHREAMLTPSKHDHDLLQVIHGVTGSELVELLSEYGVGVYVAPTPGGFGHQAAMHLAAGQLLLAERLTPAHGLECGIDYVPIDSPASLSWTLERLRRFPEMYDRPRIRGRMKAEHFRASRLFSRLVHDLRADVAAFGSATP